MRSVKKKKELRAPPPRINLYDASAIKGALDGELASLLHSRLPPDNRLSNLRLLLTAAGTLVACVAQFAPPQKYPGNFYVLAICCPLYLVINALVSYWLPAQERDIVASTAATSNAPALQLHSSLDCNAALYSAHVTPAGHGEAVSVPLGTLFFEDGTLDVVAVQRMATKLWNVK